MGDSGSWVVDPETNDLIGVVIAGCKATKEVYIIPIHDIFTDIEQCMGAKSPVSFPVVPFSIPHVKDSYSDGYKPSLPPRVFSFDDDPLHGSSYRSSPEGMHLSRLQVEKEELTAELEELRKQKHNEKSEVESIQRERFETQRLQRESAAELARLDSEVRKAEDKMKSLKIVSEAKTSRTQRVEDSECEETSRDAFGITRFHDDSGERSLHKHYPNEKSADSSKGTQKLDEKEIEDNWSDQNIFRNRRILSTVALPALGSPYYRPRSPGFSEARSTQSSLAESRSSASTRASSFWTSSSTHSEIQMPKYDVHVDRTKTDDELRTYHSNANMRVQSLPSGKSTSLIQYPCLYPGCEYTAARAYDLGRHAKTHSPETLQRLDCPFARNGFCGRMGERGFTNDSLRKEHIRKVHPRPR